MKIAIIADPLDNQRAGVHIYTREMVHALLNNSNGHEIILVREKVDPKLKGIRQIAVPNTRLPIGFASFRLFLLLPILFRRLKVDAVFEPAHFGPFNLPSRIKRITMIHDLTPILFPQYHRWHSQMLQRVFLKGILQRSDLILSNSPHTTKDLHEIYPFTQNKVDTILLGREQLYQPTTSKTYLQKYSIDQPYFLFVSTIEPRKNLLTLLKAYQKFREQTSQRVLLVIAGGKGWKSATFFEQLEEHPFRSDILSLGFVEKAALPELYSHSLALVYPSEYEGFGLPVLEAMACGTNVICANNSSLPYVGGQVPFYFETYDVEGLAGQMEVVNRGGEEVEARRAEALKQAAKFSWDTYAQSFISSIEKVVKK